MKKREKKLVLAKETVSNLSATDLREAAGGISIELCTSAYICPREKPVPSFNVC